MTFESFPLLVLHWLVISLIPRLRGINSFRRCSCCQPWHWAPFLHFELLWKLKTGWLGTTVFNPAHTLEVSQCIKYQPCFGAIKRFNAPPQFAPVRDIGPRSLPPHPRQVKCTGTKREQRARQMLVRPLLRSSPVVGSGLSDLNAEPSGVSDLMLLECMLVPTSQVLFVPTTVQRHAKLDLSN